MRLRVESDDFITAKLVLNGEVVHCWGFDLSFRPHRRAQLTVHYSEPLAEAQPTVRVELDRVLIGLTQEERATVLRFLSRLTPEQAGAAFEDLLA